MQINWLMLSTSKMNQWEYWSLCWSLWASYFRYSFFDYLPFAMTTLGCIIDEYTCLFGTKETWRKKRTQRETKVFDKNPPYSFIWPYSFNWHLRVLMFEIQIRTKELIGRPCGHMSSVLKWLWVLSALMCKPVPPARFYTTILEMNHTYTNV